MILLVRRPLSGKTLVNQPIKRFKHQQPIDKAQISSLTTCHSPNLLREVLFMEALSSNPIAPRRGELYSTLARPMLNIIQNILAPHKILMDRLFIK